MEPSTALTAFVGGWWILSGPVLWLLLLVGVFFLVRGRGGGGPWTRAGQETGIDVLERRFAEGELTLEQYRERRSVLEEKR